MAPKVILPKAGLAAWTDDGTGAYSTHEELVKRLEKVALSATAKGGDGMEATLLTWHRQLGHSSFKTVVASAKGGVSKLRLYR
jgi:hypothetical protein